MSTEVENRNGPVRFCPAYLAEGNYKTAVQALQAIGFSATRAAEIAAHECTVNGVEQLAIVFTHDGEAVGGMVVLREEAGWRLWQVWLDMACESREEAEELIGECCAPHFNGEWDVLPCRFGINYEGLLATSRVRH